jgi:hypothetical protein
MVIESVKVFILLTTAVTIGGAVAGTFLSALWFIGMLRRSGLRVCFTRVTGGGRPSIDRADHPDMHGRRSIRARRHRNPERRIFARLAPDFRRR